MLSRLCHSTNAYGDISSLPASWPTLATPRSPVRSAARAARLAGSRRKALKLIFPGGGGFAAENVPRGGSGRAATFAEIADGRVATRPVATASLINRA